jgi:hypothetical protein
LGDTTLPRGPGIVEGSTGRNDTEGRDFCADIHEFIGNDAA